MGQAEQDPKLPHLASNVLGKVQSHLCLTEWRGKWKCRWGKSKANNVLQAMLHPGIHMGISVSRIFYRMFFCIVYKGQSSVAMPTHQSLPTTKRHPLPKVLL